MKAQALCVAVAVILSLSSSLALAQNPEQGSRTDSMAETLTNIDGSLREILSTLRDNVEAQKSQVIVSWLDLEERMLRIDEDTLTGLQETHRDLTNQLSSVREALSRTRPREGREYDGLQRSMQLLDQRVANVVGQMAELESAIDVRKSTATFLRTTLKERLQLK